MEQPRIRRVPVVEPRDLRFRGTIRSDRLKIAVQAGIWPIRTPVLIHWGGVAAIVVSVLWIYLLLSLQWQTLRLEVFQANDPSPLSLSLDFLLGYWISSHLLVVPLLLFSLGLWGLYARHFGRSGRLGWFGLLLSLGGLFLVIMATLQPIVFLGENPHLRVDFFAWRPVAWWYDVASSGLAIMSLGLVLFGIASIRANAVPRWKVSMLIVTSLAIYAVPILAGSVGMLTGLVSPRPRRDVMGELLYGYSLPTELLFDYGLFAGLLVLFGVSWVLLGYSLLRQETNQNA